MKHRIGTKALSMLLALIMVVGMVPATTIAAFADGVPETLVTSLTELYSGDENRARSDLEAMYASGLIDESGSMVALDIREDGASVELAALTQRIAAGEDVGAITVNGNEATPEQIAKISQVKAALEIAALLDEEIDVTDEHVENLENLLTGIQNGSVDLESALKTGSLSLKSAGNATLLGTGNEITEYATTVWGDLPATLTLTDDGKSFVGPYISGSTYEPKHAFSFESGSEQYVDGNTGMRITNYILKESTRRDMFDWDKAIVGVDDEDRLNPVVTVVLPLITDDSVQNLIASDADADRLLDITENGVGLKMELPGYGEVNLKNIFRYMYFTYNDWYKISTGQYTEGNDPRFPVYLVESDVTGENGVKSTRVTAVATRFTAPANKGTQVRRDALSLCVNGRGSVVDDENDIQSNNNFKSTYGHLLLPEKWSDFQTDAKGYRYYSPNQIYSELYAARMSARDAYLAGKISYEEFMEIVKRHQNYDGFSLTTAIKNRYLPYYIAPATLLSNDQYIERPDGSWESAEKGFIKLKNPENREFPYVYPKDTENPQNQYDVELMYTEDLYQVYVNGATSLGEDVDLRVAVRISDRKNFSIPAGTFNWQSSGQVQLDKSDDGRYVTVIPGSTTDNAYVQAQVSTNGGDISLSPGNFKIKETEAFLLVPKSSRIRQTMMKLDTDIAFSSNVTEHNKSNTTFHAELYKINENQINLTAESIPSDAVKIEVPDWGDFPSTTANTVTHITVPGTALSTAGAYAVKLSTDYNNGTNTETLSTIVYLKAKQIPATVKLGKLESSYVDKEHLPAITYSLDNETESAKVKYTIQPSDSDTITETTGSAPSGNITIPNDLLEFDGLKKAYTITVYARNTDADPWSVDSMLLTVYNAGILQLILKDVPLGEYGGTTGGLAENGSENASGKVVHMDNTDKIINRLDNSGYAVKFEDFQTLRSDVTLQRIISANYGSGTWGSISDRMQWTVDSNGNSSDAMTLNNKESGAYGNILNRSHTSYIPTTDFLVVATDDVSGTAPVTITATHANSGMKQSFNVTVNTLHDKLYLFRFNPKTTVTLSYTDKKGTEKTAISNAQGELALYEPDGIGSDVLAMATVGDETYVGTILNSSLTSGEQNIVKLQVYPCNYLALVPISSQTLTFLKPDGKPYSGTVILRGGVYSNNVYQQNAGIRTAKEDNTQYVREDATVTVTNGKATVWFDPTQFEVTNNLRYVFEYRFAEDQNYQPGYIIIDPASNDTTNSIVNLHAVSGSRTAPQIIRQDYQQYLNGTIATSYQRNVIDSKENIGVSPNFPKADLYTVIALPGESVTEGEQIGANKGYSNYENADAIKFALYPTGDGKTKLTGQTDISSDITAAQITNLNQLNSAVYFVFPFSSMPMLRSAYTMTNENLTTDGITDEGENSTPTARIKAVITRGDMTVASMNMPFGVSNLSHQPDLNSNQGATAVGSEVRNNLKENTDIGAIFRSINVNDMIRKGFVFLGNLAGAGGDNPINLMILPTQDPATFRIIAFVGANQRGGDDDDGVSVNFNSQDLAEDMNKFKKEMEELNKKKDDDEDSGGEGSMEFNFYGTIILEARVGIADGKWNIAFRGGNVGTNVKGKYEWGQTFFCGPYPAFISFEVGFHADLEVAFGNKSAVRAMLLDAALGVSVEAFAGLGFDLSIVAIQLGIYGQIGADVNFLLLTPSDAKASTGTKLTISGEIGIKLKVKLLFISYTEKFASTGFNWTKKWNNYDQIKQYWNNQGFGVINGVTAAGRAYAMYLFADGSTIVEIEGRAELENRDYLELAERRWVGGASRGMRLMTAEGMTDVQTNAYPYSHPAFTDDGELFLYVSDNNNAKQTEAVTSYSVKSGSGYDDKGRVDTESSVLADLDVVASGTGSNAFAAWVKQVETPKRADKNAEVTNDELGMMFNATEIYAGSYSGTEWTTTRLTDNYVADMSPTVASYGSRAIVAWRSLNASSMTAGADITAAFNVENNINYSIYNGTEWTTAKVAYNGNAGTVNAIDSAMLSDGTAILVYTVRTGEDVTTTETFYTVIGTDGNAVTTGRLTNDSYTDTNAQVTAVNENGGYFVLGWYSEHDAGEGTTAEYDANGNKIGQKAVVAHDIRLARINANGSYDIDFPESVGGTGEKGITSDFRFSAPVNNTTLENVSVVWSQRKDSDKAEDAGKYELNAVRFFKAGDVIGTTAPTDIAETTKNYTIDRFDAYTDATTGAIHAIILGADYDKIVGGSVYDTIDLNAAAGNEVASNNADPAASTLTILDGEAISSLKLATGTFPATAADVTADINISEVIPGFTTPVQFTVTNTGTSVIENVKATVGSQSKDFTGLNLLPNQSATLLMSYNVPEGAVSDADYSVTSNSITLGSGTLALNRPDVGISGMKLLQEHDGVRDIQVMLSNGSEIPLADSGKTVKLAFYRDPFHESMIGEEISIPAADYADIDAGTYTTVQTLDVTKIADLVDGEIPKAGLTVYARAWVADTEEPNPYNNDNYISFTGLLARNNGVKLTTDTSLEESDGSYTVYADIRNNSMQETSVGTPVAVLLDAEGNVIAQKNFPDASLTLKKEQSKALSVKFTAEELDGKTPAEAIVGAAYTVTFDLNGGSSTETISPVQTNLEGHITLPTATPTKSVAAGADPLFFAGWYTADVGGEQITSATVFTQDTTVYAHYVNHQHNFTYAVDSNDNKTIIATCANTDHFCYLTDSKATLTIAAPEGEIVYSGSAKAAVITDANAIRGDAKVLYATKGEGGAYGEASETVPVNVGAYKASITLGSGDGAATVEVEYEITKASLTGVSVAQNGTLTYTGEAQTPQVTANATAVNSQPVTFTYSLTETGEYGDMPTFTNVSESGTTVYFKSSAPNHEEASGSFTITVSKSTPTAPAAPTTENISASSVTLTAVEGCEYSVDGTTWQDSTIFTGLTKETPYTFYQRLKETANTNASPASSAAFTTTAHDHNWGSYTVDGATITATCGNNDTFHTGALTGTMVIDAPTLKTYGQTGEGISAEATVTNNLGGIAVPTIVYKQGETVLDAAPTDVGTYTASITVAGVTASVDYEIAKAAGAPAVPAHMQWDVPDHDNNTIELAISCHSDPIHTELVTGQEYVLVLRDDTPDWSDAQELNENNVVVYTGLTPATEYDIWSRAKETANTLAGEPAKLAYTTGLIGTSCFDDVVLGNTITVSPVPETVTGLTYDWRWGTKDSEGIITYEDTPIAGETAASFTIPNKTNLAGKYLHATLYKNGVEVYESDLGPVLIPSVWTTEPAALTLTYTGVAQSLVSAGTADGCTVLYALGDDAENVPDYDDEETPEEQRTWKTTVPTATDTGTYYVWYRADGDELHTMINEECATVTIAKAEIVGATVAMDGYTYNGELPSEPTTTVTTRNDATVTLDSGSVTYYYQATAFLTSQLQALDALATAEGVYTSLASANFDAGKHYVLAVVRSDNYSTVFTAQSMFVVTPSEGIRSAPTAPTVDGTTVTVAEADRAKKLEYSLNGQTWLPVTLDENGSFTADWATPVTAATVRLREAANTNYAKPSLTATSEGTVTTTTFTVTYDANGGVNAPNAVTVTADKTVTVSGQQSMKRAGYTFDGWNTAADGSGTPYAAGDTVENGMTLYAQWKVNTYKVRFSANGGTGTMEELEFTYDAENSLTEKAFSREEYVFLGWSTTASGNVQYQDKQKVKNLAESGTVTLYAVWAKDLYNISGTVKSAETGKIDIELVQGNISFGSTSVTYGTANEVVNFTVNSVLAGTYNLIAKQGNKTMTVAVIVTDDHVALETITMPSSDTSSKLEVSGSATPGVVVGGLNEVAVAEDVSDRSVVVTMTIKAQSESENADAEAIMSEASGDAGVLLLDISVEKTIANNDTTESAEPITDTGDKVIEIIVPYDFSGKSSVKVYRSHEGVTQALTESDTGADGTYRLDRTNGLIYIYASKFSTYAIGYTVPTGGGGGGAASYTATAAASENGTVSLSRTTVTSGTKVTITVTPNAGYQVKGVAVTDARGNAVAVTKNADGTYSYTQPASNVTVTATFMKERTTTFFEDVPQDSYFYDAVNWAVEKGITQGTSETTFSPNASCTRAQMVTFLWRAAGSPEPTVTANAFTDLDASAYYYKAVLWAAEKGVTQGTSATTFSPDATVTRGQSVTFLQRALNGTAGAKNPFGDVKESDFFANAVKWAVENGVTQGTTATTFSPNDDCLRGQIVTFLYRAYNKA